MQTPASSVTTTDMGIGGMTCASCVSRVERAIGRLPEVERGLALLSAPSRGWLADFLGMVTGLVTRDGLQARYEAWQDAQAFADLPAQVRTLGELRAAFERFQDHCSVDDHIVAQQVYQDIDAALVRVREQMARAQG